MIIYDNVSNPLRSTLGGMQNSQGEPPFVTIDELLFKLSRDHRYFVGQKIGPASPLIPSPSAGRGEGVYYDAALTPQPLQRRNTNGG